ncbi:AMER1 protein, partial [Galbula dea]|nr:AMER1 protein [Galbula dea]
MEPGCPEEPARPRTQSEGCEESRDQLPKQGSASMVAVEPQQPQVPPGKLKKTAFKLFGGKRSICTLPSFFGGRSKGQGKAASKKGLMKCKTHEGLSGAGYDGGQLGSPLEGSRDSRPCLLPTSQSAHSAVDTSTRLDVGQGDSSPPGSMEGGEKKLNGEKSSFPRPKKGLKGFFNSIRRHCKSKVAECEKTELPEWTGDSEEATKAPGVGVESQEATEGRGMGPVPLAVGCPGSSEDDHSVGPVANSGEAAEPNCPTADGGSSEGDVLAMPGKRDFLDTKLEAADAVIDTEFDHGNLLLDFHPDFVDNDPPCLHSGDLLSLILGDVTSLKSFDSLTGCGDDIAEPDITESTVSVERSRDAAKRSSCLVTFQGGGEEMAIPEEAEEYLHQLWNGDVAGDRSYGAQVSSSSLETHTSHEAEAHPYLGDAMDGVDLLTPQSDQQESAPNSDEGYYDSTTPGPEEEAGDGLGEIKKDRLPRDSYSGDALYEFDALMSPSQGEEALFEGKISRPGIFSYFLDFCLPAEKSLIQMMDQKRGVMETEEERLAAIQKELLYWELQREPVLKRLDVPSKETCPREKQCVECKTRAGSSLGKGQSGLGSEQVASGLRAVNGGGSVARAENPEWRDFAGPLCPENCYDSQKGPGSCLIQLTKNNLGFDSDTECGLFGGSIHGGIAPAKAGMFPGYRLPEQEHGGVETAASKPQEDDECEPEHAVNFSQALVEFASSGTLFSSLSESLGSSASGSSFTQNLPPLPTMVTFDVVDVEQEGEGECEQHPEMNAGEDIAEEFDDGYGRKESLAECDERMYPLGSFQSCNWGVTSLPRHLRLHGLSPSMPAPLSVDRRSRSLDTESLEFELADAQLAKGAPQPSLLWARRESGKKDSSGARRSRSKEEGELVAPDGGLSWPGLQHLHPDSDVATEGMKHWGFAPDSAWESSEQPGSTSPPFLSLSQPVAGETQDRLPQEAELDRHPLRPSSLPLQPEARWSREAAGSYRYHGEVPTKTLSRLVPPGETEPELSPSFPFAYSPGKRARCRPIGITKGVPHHPKGSIDALKSPECCGEPLKGRAITGVPTLPDAGNVTEAE